MWVLYPFPIQFIGNCLSVLRSTSFFSEVHSVTVLERWASSGVAARAQREALEPTVTGKAWFGQVSHRHFLIIAAVSRSVGLLCCFQRWSGLWTDCIVNRSGLVWGPLKRDFWDQPLRFVLTPGELCPLSFSLRQASGPIDWPQSRWNPFPFPFPSCCPFCRWSDDALGLASSSELGLCTSDWHSCLRSWMCRGAGLVGSPWLSQGGISIPEVGTKKALRAVFPASVLRGEPLFGWKKPLQLGVWW